MTMTTLQALVTIAVVVVGTMLTRFISFIIFPATKTPPAFIDYLGKVLPPAVMALLVVYAFKNYSLDFSDQNLSGAIASLVIVGLHLWKRNMLISIAAGTLCYMGLLQLF